jgi:hypothetical protein
MRTLRLIAAVALLGAATYASQGQTNVYSFNIYGHVNIPFYSGNTLFGNPLLSASSLLSVLLPQAPEGTTVSIWDHVADAYTTTSEFHGGAWSADFALIPGQGAKLLATQSFTNTFDGIVLAPNGDIVTNEAMFFVPPPLFTGTPGTYLLSCKTPFGLVGQDVFTFVLGRGPNEGEVFTSLDSGTQLYRTTTFSAGVWDNGEPTLPFGAAAFFTIVPEPSSLSLLILGALAVFWRRLR